MGRAARVVWHASLVLLVAGLPIALVWRFGWLGLGVVGFAWALRACLHRPWASAAALWVLARR